MPLNSLSFEHEFLSKLESIITSWGGVVPAMSLPTDFSRRSLELLDAISNLNGGVGSSYLIGSVQEVFYPVVTDGGLYTDSANQIWYVADGTTVGSAASGAGAANAILEDFFAVHWTHLGLGTAGWSILDASGLSSSPGASAAADWAADKRLVIPDMRNRSTVAAGQAPGFINRPLGELFGAETKSLSENENGPHSHLVYYRNDLAPGGTRNEIVGAGSAEADNNTSISGSGTPFSIIPPSVACTRLLYVGSM